ncbi:hypothetical protein WMF28_08850 [Sorangium sp. So ce590]|uniref:hypothetical protein n=1 Tax=Sorangium sp. So ce590 TaxID=3133317 RepID=UPI003F6433C7
MNRDLNDCLPPDVSAEECVARLEDYALSSLLQGVEHPAAHIVILDITGLGRRRERSAGGYRPGWAAPGAPPATRRADQPMPPPLAVPSDR